MKMNKNGKSNSKMPNLFSASFTKHRKKFLVIGAGKFGSKIASALVDLGQYVIIIDKDQNKVNLMSEKVDEALKVDALNENELEVINFGQIDHCIISTGANVNDSFIITLNVSRALKGEGKITVKAFDDNQQAILNSMGITNFIRTETLLSKNEALKLIYSKVNNLVDLTGGYVCYQVRVRNVEADGKTIKWLEDEYKGKIRVICTAKEDDILLAKPNSIIRLMSNLIITSPIELVREISEYLTKSDNENN